MILTILQLASMTGASTLTAGLWVSAINATMARYQINTPKRAAAFLAQIGHESRGMSTLQESMNYRADALMTMWPARFTLALAMKFGRIEHSGRIVQQANQRMIANIAYANRYGNSGVDSGDGWKYRGHGPIQLTFADNYIRCGHAIGMNLVDNPELLTFPEAGALTAGWYWNEGNPTGKSLNRLADESNFLGIGQAVNGGANGADKRLALTQSNLKALA